MNHHNKGQTLPPEPLTQAEVLALMDACSRRAPTGRRDRALICVLWRAQLRISEALALKPSDFDDHGTLRVLRGKGQKHRIAVLDGQACAELTTWLRARDKLGVNGHQTIFCTLQGGRMNPAQLREKLPRLARKAGITKRVHAHGLRHTGASELAAEGVDLITIQQQLGHSSASTTDRYLHQINPQMRIQALRSRTY
jgi:site-specific recombinase XerD